MAEYIEKEAALMCLTGVDMPASRDECIVMFTDRLYNLPAADVQPVRRGKWVYYKNKGIWDIHKCTVCNTPFELPMDVVPSSVFCYCPHCGAKMSTE